MIELRRIYKTFPSNGARALEGASLELRPGEIHAVFGENGAGKSTLMQILAGFERPDSGEIIVDGKLRRFLSPAGALALGIGMVRQRPELCPGLRVWEACVLGAEARRGPFMLRAVSRSEVVRLSREWGFDLPADAAVESLDAAGRQRAAVLAALLRKIRFIIFDEPTAVLNQLESERFFALVRRLSESGLSPVIVSHKIDETLALAGRATVLRKGITAAVLDRREFDTRKIAALMFGSEPPETSSAAGGFSGGDENESLRPPPAKIHPPKYAENVRLEVRNLSAGGAGCPAIRAVSMELRGGAIYGLAGVRESGVERLMLAIAGCLRPASGSVMIDGRPLDGSVSCFRQNGGACLGMGGAVASWDGETSLADNLAIHAHRRFPHPRPALKRTGWLDFRSLREWVSTLLRGAGINFSPRVKIRSLSGGMLQNLLTRRELAENASVILMSEPGWGLDTRRRRALFGLLRSEADNGKTALLFLSDLSDLLEVTDEVFVMCGGGISLHLTRDALKNGDVSAVKSLINGAITGTAGAAEGRRYDGGA
ncbi:MAG: ATP-binding cassette domain-containing protein [Spirochaetaceae bacterium]|nr:ATP-binding cassette domain-containing protein [Spirochaetaceae bacterium]